ncbi:MAG: hypothetical protein P8I41_05070, partial [Flavobacteriaceae bacterium]|nr:hypothetical protein [Flavobacteriaceae bacterium]
YFLILIISLFYLSFYLKLDYVMVGVIGELVLLPSILGQLGISIYFLVKVLKRQIKISFQLLLIWAFSVLLVLSFFN